MKTQNDQSQDQILQEEQSGLEILIIKIKTIIFNVLFVLLKDEEEEEDILQLYYETTLDYLQMHSFSFHEKIQHIWRATDFLSIVFRIFEIFNTQKYMPRINYLQFIFSIYAADILILLVILDILYVSYSFQRKKFTVFWPLDLLRSVASLLVTVFFLPITETLISIVQCTVIDGENGEGPQLTLDAFPDVICWQGWHLVHASIASFFNIFFVAIATIVSLSFFEPRMNSGDRTAKMNSSGEVAFTFTKVLCQTLFSFIPVGNDWIFVLLLLALSFILYWQYAYGDPYYDKEVGLFYKIVTFYFLWTNFMLFVSKLFDGTSFNGGLIAWMVGLPFIVLIMISTRKSRIQTLISGQQKFKSGEEVWGHIRYVLSLIDEMQTDKNSYLLLLGYIEKHKEDCPLKKNCPLIEQQFKKRKKDQDSDKEMEETIKNIYLELDRIYIQYLKKYPQCVQLKLTYGFFLLERMKNKTKAKEQFASLGNLNSTFAEQFIIFRFKEILQENMIESEDETHETDILEKIKFESLIQSLEDSIKLSSILYKQFWEELMEDSPNLGKLNSLGPRIQSVVHEVQSHFQGLEKIDNHMTSILKVYANYVIQVLNDREQGEKYYEQMQKKIALEIKHEKNDNFDWMTQPKSQCCVSYDDSKLGVILQANSLFSFFFGYQLDEVLNKNIDMIIPNIYSDVHIGFMRRFKQIQEGAVSIENLEEDNFNYLEVMQRRFGRNKNGYIFPLSYQIFFENQDEQNYNFICDFQMDTQQLKELTRVHVYILTDTQGIITDISASAITFWNQQVEMKNIIKRTTNLQSLFQIDVLQDAVKNDNFNPEKITKAGFFSGRGDTIQIQHLAYDGITPITTAFLMLIEPLIINVDLLINQEEIETIEKLHGFKLKLERKEQDNNIDDKKDKDDSESSSSNSSASVKKEQSEKEKQEPEPMGLFTIAPIQQLLDEIEKNNKKPSSQMQFIFNLYDNLQNDEQEFELYDDENLLDIQKEKYKYDQNIIIKRLVNSKIELLENFIEEKKQNDDDDEFDPATSVFNQDGYQDKKQDGMIDEKEFFEKKNTRRIIQSALKAKHKNPKVQLFKIISLIWIIIIIIISFFQYMVVLQRLESFSTSVQIIQIVNIRNQYINQLINSVFDRVLIDENVGGDYFSRQQLHDQANQNIQNLIDIDIKLSDFQYEKYLSQFQKNISVRIFNREDQKSYNWSLFYLNSLEMIQIISLNLIQDPNNFTINDSLSQTIFYNYFSELNIALESFSQFLNTTIYQELGQTEVELCASMIILFIATAIIIGLFIILIVQIKEDRESVLFLFLEIPQEQVKLMSQNCGKCSANYISIRDLINKKDINQEGEHEFSEDEFDENNNEKMPIVSYKCSQSMLMEKDQEEDLLVAQKHKRRKIIKHYKNNKFKGSIGTIIKYLSIAIFTLTLVIINLSVILSQKNQIQFIWHQYYYSSYHPVQIGKYLNMQKMMLSDYTVPIFDQDSQQLVTKDLNAYLTNNQDIINFYYELLQYSSYQSFQEYFTLILFGDVCPQIQTDKCDQILNGSFKLGLTNVDIYYFDVFKHNVLEFNKNVSKLSSLLSNQKFIDIEISLYNYYAPANQMLINFVKNIILDQINLSNNLFNTLIACFMTILVIFSLVFWIPYVKSLNKGINRSIEMLNILPVEIMKQSTGIKRYVINLVKEVNKSSNGL